jgi:asparagine synthase (glutamine-hydrolysing)
MCRIAGIYSPNSNTLEKDILLMRDAMYRGGPDGAGVYLNKVLGLAFGHRRLALIDLSEAGHQPMSTFNNDVIINFNGEIYNYLEIKDELEDNGYNFNTKTDTEVILLAYKHWGVKCFEKFNGMFALAILDLNNNKLILARDHAGIKPLYYSLSNTQFLFASEVKAFKAYNANWVENSDWKIYFLAYGHLPEPFTTLENVYQLPKGNYAVYNFTSFEFKTEIFYEYKYSNTINNLKIASEVIRENFEKAVERHLISDAPIGVFLSGGIDSSIITILAAKYSKKIKTLSIVFEEQGFSEDIYQKMIANLTNIEHKSFLVTSVMFYEEFDQIMKAMDQPSIDGINTYFICKFAKEYGLTAVLSGLGADELFGGYDSTKRSRLLKFIGLIPNFILNQTEKVPIGKIKRISYLNNLTLRNKYLFYRGIYTPNQISKILSLSTRKVIDVLDMVTVTPYLENSLSQEASHLEQHLYMQNQLLKDTDFMSMWHGIEVRVPFLDKDFISVCNTIHPNIKLNPNKRPKQLLIDSFLDVLPSAIWNRKKQGFSFPFTKWMSYIIPQNHNEEFELIYKYLPKKSSHWSKYWAYVLVISNTSDIIFLKPYFKRIVFYNLDAFASMGGIEKFNRALLFGLSILEKQGKCFVDSASIYDTFSQEKYFKSSNYRTYKKQKKEFVLSEIFKVGRYEEVILGHVNLAIFGVLIKIIYPKKKVYLITHGIEVWDKLSGFRKRILKKVDIILAVSNYTKDKLIEVNNVASEKIKIFHNTLDPHFVFPVDFRKPDYLRDRYKINNEDKIIFTLTRLAFTEKYKGYDKVIEVLPGIIPFIPNVKYLIAGKPDEKEKVRLLRIIEENKLQNNVFLIGFVADEEVTDHYMLADVFIMPSQKEGFGIVFIEAMACGLPVIAGNKDGSVDALQNGKLGTLINPDDKVEIANVLTKLLLENRKTNSEKNILQNDVQSYFGFDVFCKNLEKQLEINE